MLRLCDATIAFHAAADNVCDQRVEDLGARNDLHFALANGDKGSYKFFLVWKGTVSRR
jgi:hypothetical protein